MAVPDRIPETDEREPYAGSGGGSRSPDTAAGDSIVHVNPKISEIIRKGITLRS
jgi:hypothetical protein